MDINEALFHWKLKYRAIRGEQLILNLAWRLMNEEIQKLILRSRFSIEISAYHGFKTDANCEWFRL